MRSIRVRQVNLETALNLLKAAGFTAEPCETPNSHNYIFRSYPDQDYAWDQERHQEDVQGMAGILTSASGQQAHKVFVEGGMFKQNRECTCGSGLPWTTCSACR